MPKIALCRASITLFAVINVANFNVSCLAARAAIALPSPMAGFHQAETNDVAQFDQLALRFGQTVHQLEQQFAVFYVGISTIAFAQQWPVLRKWVGF